MAKTKETKQVVSEETTLSSGVTVTVLPFPPGLMERIGKDYPDPTPPTKEIAVFNGTESVPDLNDPTYKEELERVQAARNRAFLEAAVEMAVEVDISKYESVIKRLEKVVSSYPDDSDERRSRFLREYALRTNGDYGSIIAIAVNLVSVGEEEVQERMASFQGKLAQRATNGTEAPGLEEVVGVAVESPQA